MADPPASEFVGSIQNTAVVCREKPKAGPDNLLILSEMGEDSFNKAAPIKGCKISTLGKAMAAVKARVEVMQLLGSQGFRQHQNSGALAARAYQEKSHVPS